MLFVCFGSVCLLVRSSAELLKVAQSFLHGWFPVVGSSLVAPNEIFKLSGALVSDYEGYKAAHLERIIASGIARTLLYLSITGR